MQRGQYGEIRLDSIPEKEREYVTKLVLAIQASANNGEHGASNFGVETINRERGFNALDWDLYGIGIEYIHINNSP